MQALQQGLRSKARQQLRGAAHQTESYSRSRVTGVLQVLELPLSAPDWAAGTAAAAGGCTPQCRSRRSSTLGMVCVRTTCMVSICVGPLMT